jgi:NDP-sugar pyrophosphorylase family protein
MQAVILAAGKGERLGSLTQNRSKAMVPILGVPIAERVMASLVMSGLDDLILVVSPDDHLIGPHFRHGSELNARVRIRTCVQPEPLGMAHALRQATRLIHDDFVLAACDNLVPAQDVARMLALWQTTPQLDGLLALTPVAPEQVASTGIVEIEGGRVIRIVEKPAPEHAPSTIASIPLYCFSRRILEYLPAVARSARGEYELQDAIQMLIDRGGHVRGVMIAGRLSLTSPADLLTINRHYMARHEPRRRRLAAAGVGPDTRLISPVYIGPGTVIGAHCVIGPNAVIEQDCRVGDRATIQNATLLPGAVVARGATVRDQVVVDRISSGATL